MRRHNWLYSFSLAAGILLMLIPTHQALAQQSELSVEILEATPRAQAGGRVIYTVRVTNNGPSFASFVSVVATTSSQLQITRNSCGVIGRPAYCPFGGLPAGQSRIVTFEGEVCCFPSGSPRRATFRVELSGSFNDPNLGNNAATGVTQITGPFQN